MKASLDSLQFDLKSWESNERIGNLVSSSVLKDGKRLRPILTFLAADIWGVSHDQIAPFARVVELVHAATLAHDDVIDQADFRRGKPSINAIAGNKKAVLAGDYLLAYSLSEVASYQRPRLVTCLAEIISDLAEGEWIQIENSDALTLTETDVDRVALKKTGSVLRWCSQAAPLYLDIEGQGITLSREFGETLGLAFQMTDDILDFKRNDGSELADIKNDVINSVIFKVWSMKLDSESISPSSVRGKDLPNELIEPALNSVRKRVHILLQRCKDILDEIEAYLPLDRQKSSSDPAKQALLNIIHYLDNRI